RVEKESFHRGVAGVDVHVVNGLLTAKPGKWIQNGVAQIVKYESPVDAVRPLRFCFWLILTLALLLALELTSTAASTGAGRLRTETVIEADEHRIRAAGSGRNEVKILAVARQVRRWNETEKLRCCRVDAGKSVVRERRVCYRIK